MKQFFDASVTVAINWSSITNTPSIPLIFEHSTNLGLFLWLLLGVEEI
jgi:hypothetical protein